MVVVVVVRVVVVLVVQVWRLEDIEIWIPEIGQKLLLFVVSGHDHADSSLIPLILILLILLILPLLIWRSGGLGGFLNGDFEG